MTAPAEGAVTCGFCGEGFVEDREQHACRRCPLSPGCRFVRCPRCGFENPVPLGWLDRLIGKMPEDAPMSLVSLSVGEHATVVGLEDQGSRATGRLAALGVLPGAPVVLVQRRPAFVFRIGHSELAVDAELARRIRVRRERA